MAQPEILSRPEKLKKKLLHDLVDRFFTQLYRLRGVRGEEFEEILEHYDTAEWPVGSGISYTCHFLPEDWKRGWRLKAQAPIFREEFQKITSAIGRHSDGVGMKYFVAGVRGFLVAAQANTDPRIQLSDLLRNSIQRCGMREAYAVVGDAENDARNHRPPRGKGAAS